MNNPMERATAMARFLRAAERIRSAAGLRVQGGEVAEGHGRADGGPWPRVAAAHHQGAGVAGRVQPFDDAAVVAEHPGVLVRAQPALGAEVARDDLEGVE